MKMKKIITLSAVAFLSTALYANADLDTMKAQLDELNAKIEKMEEKQTKQSKQISSVNKKANNDNIKWDVDFRTAYDNLEYKTSGTQMSYDRMGNPAGLVAAKNKYKNNSLYSMRLWLGMGYAPTENMIFKGQLAMHKAFGASNGQRGTGMGFDTFDWIVNENLTDGTVRVREAYWLWTPSIGDLGLTMSVGRRPATNGYLINLRDDDKAKSPLGHVINMEFDGASVGFKLDKFAWSGLNFKVCAGRGLTNAGGWGGQPTFYAGSPMGGSTQPNYTTDKDNLNNTDMLGFILKAYDDGQYAIEGTFYRGFDVPGMVMNANYNPMNATGMAPADPTRPYNPAMMNMTTLGDMDGAAVSAKIEGIGDEWSDFLDETIIFASYAWSKSHPKSDISDGVPNQMLGGTDTKSKTGNSYWIGTQMPNLTGGKFGLEFNHGNKDWKPFTFGEDTFAGSKIATRGDAYEAYWTQPIVDDIFSMQVRYTMMDYEYTGSGGFFGQGSASYKIGSIQADSMNSVEKAQDIRVYFRYRY